MELTGFEILFRLIPESLLYFYWFGTITKINVTPKNMLVSSLFYSVATILARMLPIELGLHSILILICLVIFINYYYKIVFVQALKITLITSILLYIAEGISVLCLMFIFGDIGAIISNPINKVIAGTPTLIILYGIIYTYNKSQKESNYYTEE